MDKMRIWKTKKEGVLGEKGIRTFNNTLIVRYNTG